MKVKDMQQFAEEILNLINPLGIRGALRERVAAIDRLETLYASESLRLTRLNIDENGPSCFADYEVISPQRLYPSVRNILVARGVTSRNLILRSSVQNRNQADEHERVMFGVSGNSIIISLKAYNPHYKSSF